MGFAFRVIDVPFARDAHMYGPVPMAVSAAVLALICLADIILTKTWFRRMSGLGAENFITSFVGSESSMFEIPDIRKPQFVLAGS